MKGFWQEVENLGVEPNPYRAGFLQLVAVSETDEKAKEYAPYIEYFFNKCLHIPDYFTSPPGYRTKKTVKAGLSGAHWSANRQREDKYSWKDYIEKGNVIVGSPSTVTEKLREAITKLRVGHMMLLCQFGDMPKELTNQNTALFAEELMPNLRDIWKDYEDHWWPKPISENDRVYPDRKA